MALKITYANKIQAQALPNPVEELWRSDDANEVKTVVNSLSDDIEAFSWGQSTATASRDLAISDQGKVLEANAVGTILLNLNTQANIAYGSKPIIIQRIDGPVRIIKTAGVTLLGINNGTADTYEIELKYGCAILIKKGVNLWTIAGNLLLG